MIERLLEPRRWNQNFGQQSCVLDRLSLRRRQGRKGVVEHAQRAPRLGARLPVGPELSSHVLTRVRRLVEGNVAQPLQAPAVAVPVVLPRERLELHQRADTSNRESADAYNRRSRPSSCASDRAAPAGTASASRSPRPWRASSATRRTSRCVSRAIHRRVPEMVGWFDGASSS